MARGRKWNWIDTKPDVVCVGRHWISFGELKRVAEWFEFLRFSPSYELARRHRAGELSPGASLPRDFDTVLAVYDDLGDVTLGMNDWLEAGAGSQFGHGGRTPDVMALGSMSSEDADESQTIADNLQRYRQTDWVEQGERSVMVVAIPLGLSKSQIARQVALLVADYPEDKPQAPKYQMATGKTHWDSIYRYRRCLDAKADLGEATLWRIGLRANVSPTYTNLLNRPNEPAHKQAEYRQALKVITSRALSRGHMIAENAARGIFPTYAACQRAVPLDWNRIRQQREAWSADAIGDVELDAGREFDPIWKQDSDGKWFDASPQGQKDRDRR